MASGSYRQILRTTTITASSSAANILIGIVRTKVLSVLLGPSGVGLTGLYLSVTNLVGAIADMGITRSGVRQIAEANGSHNPERISQTIISLRRTAMLLGLAGMLFVLLFRRSLSQMTFGDTEHAGALGFLSLTIFFASVSGGQTALIQGMRRIRDLAAQRVLGVLLGTFISIPVVFFMGARGIPLFLVLNSATVILLSWWFARRIHFDRLAITWRMTVRESSLMLRLGLAFMLASFVTMGAGYVIRLLIMRRMGLEATGLYQSAFNLSSVYVGFILTAMGADFYPRLTAIAEDHVETNRLVNEQTEVSLLLAAPGVLATLVFAPLVIILFYSAKFAPAGEVLRWQVLGVLGRVISWPLGFIILAKGKGLLFFFTELSANVVHVAFLWIGLSLWGLPGAGMAFFGEYIFVSLLMVVVARRLTGFTWTGSNLRLGGVVLSSVFVASVIGRMSPGWPALLFGGVLTVAISFYSLLGLSRVAGAASLGDFAGMVLMKLGHRKRAS